MRCFGLAALVSMVALAGCGAAGNDETGSLPEADAARIDAGGHDDANADDGAATSDDASDAKSTPDAVVEGEGAAGTTCPTPPIADPIAADRNACKFDKGAKVAETLGITKAIRAAIPLTHVVIVMNENRSFDHYFGKLSVEGQPEAEGFPATFSNKDSAGNVVKPFHLSSTCLERDCPHGWAVMHDKYDGGKMDGFVTGSDVDGSNGHFAMGYYTKDDLPFYNWLAKTYALGDRNFSSVMGPTWPNRDYLYAATSDGVTNTDERIINVPTIFDAMNTAKVKWGIYGDGHSRAGCAGVDSSDPHHHGLDQFFTELGDGTLPPVVFLDPTGAQDEHPAANVQGGEAWARRIYVNARKSPLWKKLAIIYTYDEGGGLFDHVPPPKACLASASETKFDRLGFRVPLMVVSPYSRPHFVSHKTHDHTSITRLVELLHDLPALTGRDANADALLDMFDFNCPTLLDAPDPPAAGTGGCP